MKRIYFIIVLSVLFCHSYSQQLRQVTFTENFDVGSFSLVTTQNILIRISSDGQIMEAGTEEQALYNRNYFAPKLRPYQGNIGYFDDRSDSAFRGKIKNIGTCFFTYYSSKDYPEKAGKIKSAGSLYFDYYRNYEDASIAGRIKNINGNAIAYFTSLDDEALKGKLKIFGTTPITYYSSFDNVLLKGKLKSIGPYHCEWTTVYSGGQSFVTLRSGYQRQLINGITYIIQ